MKKAVFLDRDGVINKAIVKNGLPTSPSLLSELKILHVWLLPINPMFQEEKLLKIL